MEPGFSPSPVWCQSPHTSHHQLPLKAEAAPLARSPGPLCSLSITGAVSPSIACHKHIPQSRPAERKVAGKAAWATVGEGGAKSPDLARTVPSVQSTLPQTPATPPPPRHGPSPLPSPLSLLFPSPQTSAHWVGPQRAGQDRAGKGPGQRAGEGLRGTEVAASTHAFGHQHLLPTPRKGSKSGRHSCLPLSNSLHSPHLTHRETEDCQSEVLFPRPLSRSGPSSIHSILSPRKSKGSRPPTHPPAPAAHLNPQHCRQACPREGGSWKGLER